MKENLQKPISFIIPDMPFSDLAKHYLQAMLVRELKKGRDLVMDAVERGENIRELYLYVFQPVMYEIGVLWERGEITVGQEHYCTNATQVTMAMLYPKIFNGSRKKKRLLAACVEGELHELGLRMVTDFFEMNGWDTDYLGASTPPESIVRALEEKPADMLAIGATMHYNIEKAHTVIDAVRRVKDLGNVKIILGGYTFKVNETLWKTLGADGFAVDAGDAVRLADTLTDKGKNHAGK